MGKRNNMTTMRIDNTISILRILYEKGSLSRSRISQLTKLSSSAVTSITKDLKNKKIIEEQKPVKKQNMGRPVKPLAISRQNIYVLGINLSGEAEIEIAVFNLFLKKLKGLKIKLKNYNPTNVVKKIIAAYKKLEIEMPKNAEFIGFGISVSGIIANDEKIHFSETLNWKKVDIKSDLEKAIDIPIIIKRDVDALATFEYMSSDNNAEIDPFAEIVIGRGVGLGMIINGKIFSGHLAGGEISHITSIDSKQQKKCRCGQINCISTILSRRYLADRILKLNLEQKNSKKNEEYLKKEPLNYLFNNYSETNSQLVSQDFTEAVSKLLKIITEIYSPKEIIINSSYIIPNLLKKEIQSKYIEKVFLPEDMVKKINYSNHLGSEWSKASASIVIQNLLYSRSQNTRFNQLFD